MRAIARFTIRHARLTLGAWALVLVAALAFGASATDHIGQPSLRIPGSDSARAADLTNREFGGTISMAVLLEGPPKLVEQRGPRLVRELQEIEGVEVLSPWAIGGERVLKEPRGQALLALQVRRPFDRISDETMPAVAGGDRPRGAAAAEGADHRAWRRSCARSTSRRSTRSTRASCSRCRSCS